MRSLNDRDEYLRVVRDSAFGDRLGTSKSEKNNYRVCRYVPQPRSIFRNLLLEYDEDFYTCVAD